jgi:hypothetical protein
MISNKLKRFPKLSFVNSYCYNGLKIVIIWLSYCLIIILMILQIAQ